MSELADEELILQRFFHHAATRPDAVYLTQPLPGGRIENFSFARTLDEARRLAAYLRSLKLPRQSKIALVSKNCAHFFVADLAIWMAGHVSVALYPTLTADIVRFILEHSEAKLLFWGKLDDAAWPEIQKGIPEQLPCVAMPLAPESTYTKWTDLIARYDPIEDLPTRDADDEALIIYTSGSTGRPKGVLHSFRTISAPTPYLVELLDINSADRLISYLPLAHSMDRWLSECVSLYAGCRVFFAQSLDTFVEDLKRARPTLFASVPRLWLKFQQGVFAKLPEKKLSRLLKIPIVSSVVKKKVLAQLGLADVRFAASGSAPIPAELIGWFRDLGLELLEGYGMSENFNYSHLTLPGQGRPGYIGHPQPGVSWRLSEDNEILVKSPGNMVGYYKEPELTRAAFTDDGYLKTGDQGDVDEAGRLKITGRIKELFKTSKGKYVAPVPIENMLNADPHVELCCVGGAGESATCALVQLAEGYRQEAQSDSGRARINAALASLQERINAELPVYERLAFVVITQEPWSIEGGQLTPTLKIRRSAIESQYAPKLPQWYAAGEKVIWES